MVPAPWDCVALGFPPVASSRRASAASAGKWSARARIVSSVAVRTKVDGFLARRYDAIVIRHGGEIEATGPFAVSRTNSFSSGSKKGSFSKSCGANVLIAVAKTSNWS